MPPKKFIKAALAKNDKVGVLRQLAAREHGLTQRGTIKKAWLQEKAKGKGVTGRRARFALTLGSLKK